MIPRFSIRKNWFCKEETLTKSNRLNRVIEGNEKNYIYTKPERYLAILTFFELGEGWWDKNAVSYF